jgi:hypothetical protein
MTNDGIEMITFKQFLIEGGKATEKLGTVRATKADIDSALDFVSRCTDIGTETLRGRLLGSTRLTHAGKQADSGDVDIAIHEGEVDQDMVIARMTKSTKNKPHVIGGSVYSFAVPTAKDRKVQVDLMFVPDIEWAKFSHFAAAGSKHKSAVRNELIHSALKFSMEPGKDVRLKDENGNDIARASRAYNLVSGAGRIFKIAQKRKDGKGRVKSLAKVSPDEVRRTLDQEGQLVKFSPEEDAIRDPDRFAALLFGSNVKAADMGSTEQLIDLIKRFKSKNANAIFKDAVKGIKRLKFEVPAELKKFE